MSSASCATVIFFCRARTSVSMRVEALAQSAWAPRMRRFVADELYESACRSVDDCAVDLGHLDAVGANVFRAELRRCLRFGHADVSYLEIGVEAPWDVVVADGRAAGEEHVAHELHGLVRGDVRELHAAVNVAAGPDARDGRLQVLVDDDKAAVGLDEIG